MLAQSFILLCFVFYIGWLSYHGIRDIRRHREISRSIPLRTPPEGALRDKMLADLNHKYKMEEVMMEQADMERLARYKEAIECLERNDWRSVFLMNEIYA